MKKVISLIFVFALLCSMAMPVFADTQYVYDYVNNFTESEITELNEIADKIYTSYGFSVFCVRGSEELDGEGTINAAEEFYNNVNGSNDGLMLYTSADYWYIHYSDYANSLLSDDEKETLENAFKNSTDYYNGMKAIYNVVESKLSGDDIITTFGSNGFIIPEDQHYDEQGIFITDDAGLLTSTELKELNDKLAEINQRQGFIVAVATTNTFNGKSVVAYSDDLFEERYSTTSDGAILTINMSTRDWYISTQGYGITALTDHGIDYLGEQFVSYLSDGEYYDAFNKYADLCDEFVTEAKTNEPYDYGHMPKSPYNVPLGVFGSLLTGGISSLIGVTGMKGKLKSVRVRNDAAGYSLRESFNVANQDDVFLYNTVSKTRRVEESSSRGGYGGSSTHSSSSGTSHGGGGGKF